MKLSTTLAKRYDSTSTRDMAMAMSMALKTEHADRPFKNSLEVSSWLSSTYPNPRTTIETHENGSPIVVKERASGAVLLTITCTPSI